MNALKLDEETIYHVARRIADSEARSAYLDQVCTGDPALRGRVERLLRICEQEASFMEAPACGPTMDLPTAGERPGTIIGLYKLMEQIGEGGMGVVYVAEQTKPVRRKVALKIIKPGMDTKQVIGRFEAERQALAMMDHPNIAKVHDAGSTESGRPYFVMELVRGIPLTDYCDREQLSIHERLELFVLVCRAVQHAHQKGIIHRDLKPSNILVTVIDGAAVPKIIDFGVAKATGASLTERTIYTAFQQFVGTPLYMSPEQADLSGMDVDTRSDIYSLGVLLYELLTGTTPFDRETFRQAAFDELRRIIREQEPPKPSTRLSTLGATRATVSANRKADFRQLDRAVRGELDWIVMKALEKDRRRRYETANDFAADVMRYLTHKPVEACPPSPWYRFSKYARRNRATLTTAALVALALAAGTATSVWQARKAGAAAAEARQRSNESQQVIKYLARDVFGGAVPGKGRGRSLTIGELLDRADASVAARFRQQPLAEASVRMALAESYRSIYDLERAVKHAARAVDIRARLLGPEHPETLRAMEEQAADLCWAGAPAAGVPLCRRVLAARRRVLGPTHPETVGAQSFLAFLLLDSRLDEASALATDAETTALRALGPDHPMTLAVWDCLGHVNARRGDFARAEAMRRRCYLGRERLLGPLDPDTIGALENLANLLRELGRLDEARPLYLEVVQRNNQVFGPTHIQGDSPRYWLEVMLCEQGDYAALRDLLQGWLREILATPAEADPYQRGRRVLYLSQYASSLAELPPGLPIDADLAIHAAEEAAALDANVWRTPVQVYAHLGRLELAARRLSEEAKRAAGDAKALNDLAWYLATAPEPRVRDPARAVKMAREAVEKAPRANNWNTLGVASYRAGDWTAAIAALDKAEALAPDKSLAFNGFFLAMAHWQLGDNAKARRWYDEAVEWMEKNQPQDKELRRFRMEAEDLLGIKAK